jgi:V-type H+-transporting ATPase subunit E
MDELEAKRCHEALLKYINRTGDDKLNSINKQANDEFQSQKSQYIKEEQARITNEYKVKLDQDEIKLKIQRSANENNARIQKMRTVNTLIEKLYKEAKVKMAAKQKEDQAQYREFLKNLIVQGLIKLMEAEVHIRCRQSDLALVQAVHQQAAEEYKTLMKQEVKLFKDRDVPIKIVIETNKFLAEYDETEGADSCLGGIVLHARKGRIVCSNTIDERLQLVYQEAIP